MKHVALAAALLLLATSEPALANGPPPHVVWEHDSGYVRARVASVIAPLIPVTLFIVAFVWAIRNRRLVVIVCLLLCGITLVLVVASAPSSFTTTFLASDATPPGRTFLHIGEDPTVRRSRPLTPEEIFLLVVCFVGTIVFVGMRFTRKLPPRDLTSSPQVTNEN